MKENVIKEKSFDFAVSIVKLYKFLVSNKKEFVLAKQLLKSGTSIGANIEEALGAQSKNDFISKISISYKEARETHYWIRLLKETGFLTEKQFVSMIKDVEEILKLITSIQKTSKYNL
ncbi:MAG: four helix bundle protein [Ignavibacteriae bacterium]|nr:four helix bundle protein [Ignavibacteriota bacterium]